MKEFVRIIALTVAAAVVYGILHDQVTARVCIEYFTIGHPPLIPSDDPTLLAIAWGTVATWWVGLPLGLLLAVGARAGKGPKWTVGHLWKPILVLLGVMYLCALLAGLTGGFLADAGQVWLLEPIASAVPRSRHVPYLAALWAHSASYLTGAGGGVALTLWVQRQRRRTASGGAAGGEGRGASENAAEKEEKTSLHGD
jgi:hypothetical protein